MEKLENEICLDSDFLIDLLRKKLEPLKWLQENSDKILYNTTINVFELFYGANKSKRNEELQSCEKLIGSFPILELDTISAKNAGKIAAELEKGNKSLEFRDILIASIAIQNKMPLKTNNKKDFMKIKELKLA